MKLTFTTADFDEPTWIAFAQSIGWTTQVLTIDQSPNYLIDNPVKYADFIISKYAKPLYQDLADFNVAQIKEQTDAQIAQANKTLKDAQTAALQEAATLVTAVIE